MLSARRQSDGQTVTAYFESRANGPFFCLTCGDEVLLKTGKNRINHFAHSNPLACEYAEGESEAHRKCKLAIHESLKQNPHITSVIFEHPLGTVRPDIFAVINGVPVAIEIQISSLSVETIMYRTIEYARKGIYVLWLLLWTPKLDSPRYAPELWEKWVHTAYFGRAYYWVEGLTVAIYSFEASFKSIPRKSWFDESGKKQVGGGYSKRLKRYKTPVREDTLNIATDFVPKERFWWSGGGLTVPDAKIFVHRRKY